GVSVRLVVASAVLYGYVGALAAHLLELAGDRAGARDAYQAAASRTTNLPQQRYLNARAARLTDDR
ncbi:MAG: hypothetical protein M3O65_11290, partial [Actinomycetota bacterium]|nr:hypothetical protein [Actinomycetota bacterium]